ncbi:glycosyltransferase family 2 protein [Aeromonas hydrophila]|uniref:glycosyltransferase family 2 protein n=1 Tax=Aeromonas hydrophila TaxID=644 RepID=UPI002B4A58E4|nr:glycosyltransferase family 2 protein [Aeromonas hydrophila]
MYRDDEEYMIVKESISIIMPAYNAERFIRESINSVLAQTYNDWHLYVVDDASTDGTAAIVKKIKDHRVEYIFLERNGGVANARNIAIEKAQGKYITFLDSDDLWEVNKLEIQVLLLEKGYDVVCGNYAIFLTDSNHPTAIRTSLPEFNYHDMLSCNRIGNLTGIYNRNSLGKFYQEHCGHEDYLMWLSVMKAAKKAACVQEVIARYRVSAGSLSGNKLVAAKWQWHIYRGKLHLSLPESLYYWLRYVTTGLGRKFFN